MKLSASELEEAQAEADRLDEEEAEARKDKEDTADADKDLLSRESSQSTASQPCSQEHQPERLLTLAGLFDKWMPQQVNGLDISIAKLLR